MIFAPPRHTKSELASRRFPAWYLGRHPNHQIISTTYSGDFASDFGRDVRDIVASEEYNKLFPEIGLRADSSAVNRWQTTGGGIYVSVGVGGPITGRGAHVAIIDDPVKNQQDADSETVRESVWNWYLTTLKTRLMKNGAIILMMTRWHEDDLAGRILKEEGGEWEVLKLPAITDGKALWDEWFPLEELETHKKHKRTWEALYQQNPTPDEGVFFRRESIKRFQIGEQPEHLHKYITSDFAVTEKASADYTVLGTWGVDAAGEWWLLDVYRAQTTMDVWINALIDRFDGVMAFFGEKGLIKNASEPFLTNQMRQRGKYARLEWINRPRDKVAMAGPLRGMVETGMIHIPLTDWGEDVVTEMLKFPAGEHDDCVDMCALVGLAVDQGIMAQLPEPTEKTSEPDYVSYEQKHESFKLG